ncbi:MAG: hypothetical protein IJQ89_00660 [Bacteroidales bacterium]|nr:hypothetical protein [Bacteroidales bacterium]
MKDSIIKNVYLLFLLIPVAVNVYSQQLEFMGYPIHSTITEFSKELTSHRFRDKYTNGNLAHQYWEGGDFWKRKNCTVSLFTARDEIHVDLIEVTIPHVKTIEDYNNSIEELITDLSNKYGQYTVDTVEELEIFFYPSNFGCHLLTWSLANGELKVEVCPNCICDIKMRYESIERINWLKEAARFKGKGSSDL